MASRLELLRASKLDLKHFIYKSHVLKLYRDVLRVSKGLPDSDRSAVLAHARGQIQASSAVRDAHDIKRLLADGKNQLERLRNTLWMTR